MKRILFSITVFLVGWTISSFQAVNAPNCGDWKVEVEQEKKRDGTFEVTLKIKGATEKFNYVFYDKAGNLLSENFSKSKLDGLKPGEYGYTVVQSNGCRKSGELKLE